MSITPNEFQYMKERVLTQMIQILVEEKQMSIEDAMTKVYTSEIFEKLSDPATGLYFQSPRYILSYLDL